VFAPSTPDPGGLVKFEPGGARPVPSVNCIFNDGRSAAWAGATLARCPYGDPFLARAWVCGWRAGQAERRARHG
jgi:ribosome modulation factor